MGVTLQGGATCKGAKTYTVSYRFICNPGSDIGELTVEEEDCAVVVTAPVKEACVSVPNTCGPNGAPLTTTAAPVQPYLPQVNAGYGSSYGTNGWNFYDYGNYDAYQPL